MTYELTAEERSLLAEYGQAVHNLQQQCEGAMRAMCAARRIKGAVEFKDGYIETKEETQCSTTPNS